MNFTCVFLPFQRGYQKVLSYLCGSHYVPIGGRFSRPSLRCLFPFYRGNPRLGSRTRLQRRLPVGARSGTAPRTGGLPVSEPTRRGEGSAGWEVLIPGASPTRNPDAAASAAGALRTHPQGNTRECARGAGRRRGRGLSGAGAAGSGSGSTPRPAAGPRLASRGAVSRRRRTRAPGGLRRADWARPRRARGRWTGVTWRTTKRRRSPPPRCGASPGRRPSRRCPPSATSRRGAWTPRSTVTTTARAG